MKEAAYKALFPTIKVSWKQLSFTKLPGNPKPVLKVDTELDGLDFLGDLHASISHDGEYVVAYVIAEKSSMAVRQDK